MSVTQDENIQRQMNPSWTIREFVDDRLFDASSPEQLDGLAFQLLCIARRCKSNPKRSKEWKAAWRDVTARADAARARVAALPSRKSHPQLFNPRSVGKPGHLDCDLHLPFHVQVDLETPTAVVAMYEPDLRNGARYKVLGSRDGRTWLEPLDGKHRATPVPNGMLRGLQALGRLVPISSDQVEGVRQAA